MKRLFAFALLSVALRHSANAAVIYSGLQNIAIPTDYNGIYINIDNGATSGSTILGWDINPFFGGAGLGNSSAFQPARLASGNLDPILRLNMGDVVGAALTYSTGLGGSGDPVSYLGAAANQFQVGSEGYLGFRFTTDTSSGPYYGWMRVVFTNNTSGGVIKDWAYEDSGTQITISGVPEPSRAVFVLLGLFGLLMRRRRAMSRC
ncbi:MAG: PEP-CTERM sorting domain-containing protein [Verrucomicrobiaceae bacterium]